MFSFDNNTFARDLPDAYTVCQPEESSKPELLYFNHQLAGELGFEFDGDETKLTQWFSGNETLPGSAPLAQVYAGHQFGHFNPQLGDGRALLLGEVIDKQGVRQDIAFKGSGRTPYSRNGDGKAAVGPMLREALISEAMHALGIPSTRTLAVVKTGDVVYRETTLPGALLTRVAQSHIRVGTFEYFAARDDLTTLRALADYTLGRHPAELSNHEDPYLALLDSVCQRQARLIAQWIGVGFIHGVMNTDNMSIAGETIDYGPCAFMEAFNPKVVFSSIDHQGRYAYQNQPGIAQWNLARFAEALLPLIDQEQSKAVEKALAVLDDFARYYQQSWLEIMLAKLGLSVDTSTIDKDIQLIQQWLGLLEQASVDYTLAWHHLSDALLPVSETPSPAPSIDRLLVNNQEELSAWLQQWQQRGEQESANREKRVAKMRQHNPWLTPRNHRVEEALASASNDSDLTLFKSLLNALQAPYTIQPEYAHLAKPANTNFTQSYQTFCGT